MEGHSHRGECHKGDRSSRRDSAEDEKLTTGMSTEKLPMTYGEEKLVPKGNRNSQGGGSGMQLKEEKNGMSSEKDRRNGKEEEEVSAVLPFKRDLSTSWRKVIRREVTNLVG